MPIEFRFGTAEFTPRGARAARDLLESLRASGDPAITLVGHTDPVGGVAANQVLSERRATAVRDFLMAEGYTGTVSVVGQGEAEPLQLEEHGRFTTDRYHQMLRRVELVR